MGRSSGWNVDTLKELCDQRFMLMDQALKLQTEELSRRLDNLNHAHQRDADRQATYVPREVFEASVASLAKEFDDYKTTTNRALILREGQSKGIGLSVSLIFSVVAAIGVFGGLIGYVLH